MENTGNHNLKKHNHVSELVQNHTAIKTIYHWFQISLGVFSGMFICLVPLILCYYFGKMVYDRWFNMDGLIEVGERGYCLDTEHECLVKPWPHRRVIKGCKELTSTGGDTIGIIQLDEEKYRYVNLNTLSYINDKTYDCAYLFEDGIALAFTKDTAYHISTTGKTISAEPLSQFDPSIEEIICSITDEDGFCVSEAPTGCFKYNVNEKYGLMSSDSVRLTKPIFSDIKAISKDVFWCEYDERYGGVLIDKNGKTVKMK